LINLLQKLVPKIGVRGDYSLLQVAALVTKLVSWGQVQATVGAQKEVLAKVICHALKLTKGSKVFVLPTIPICTEEAGAAV